MPFQAFTIKVNLIILSLVSVDVFALASQPIQSLLENQCNSKEKCILKQLNTSQCLIAGKCDLCGRTQVDDISYAYLKKALQCSGLTDELQLQNKAGGVAILSSHEVPSPDLSWDICETEPDLIIAAEPNSRKSLLEKVNVMSHCKDKDCIKQNVKFRLCSQDVDKNLQCFAEDGVQSYPLKKGVHALYFDEDIKCKKCLLQMSYLDGRKELPIGCFPISIMPKKSVRKNKLKRFAEEVENGSLSNETSSGEGGALEAREETTISPEVVEEAITPEVTNEQNVPKTTKTVTVVTAAPKPKHKPIRPIHVPLLKPKIMPTNVVQKLKPADPKPEHAPTTTHASTKPKLDVHTVANATKAVGKPVLRTTLRTSKRPRVSTKRSLDHQVRPLAMTRHIEVDPVKKRPTTSSTKSFDDMWKEKMQEFEEKKKDRFQAFKAKNNPPSADDPFIKVPPENTFESKGNGCDVIKWSLVLQAASFLWICLCG